MSDKAAEVINRRRKQMHVHSVLYYHLHKTVITDAEFDAWSQELVALQEANPELAHQGYRHDLFHDWTGDTGMHLPATDEIVAVAESLLRYQE